MKTSGSATDDRLLALDTYIGRRNRPNAAVPPVHHNVADGCVAPFEVLGASGEEAACFLDNDDAGLCDAVRSYRGTGPSFVALTQTSQAYGPASL